MRCASCMSVVIVSAAWSALVAAENGARPEPGQAEVPTTPYVQAQVIVPPADHGRILGFCVPTAGGLVAVTGMSDRLGPGPQRPDGAPVHRLVWFATDGSVDREMDLDFAATAIGSGPDGGVYVGGDGTVALVSSDGVEVTRGTTPQGPQTDEELAELEKSITDRLEAQCQACEKQIERQRDAVAELKTKLTEAEAEARAAGERSPDDEHEDDEHEDDAARTRRHREARARETRVRNQAVTMATQLSSMENQLKRLRQQDPRQLLEQSLRRPRQVRAVTGTGDAVFVVTGEASGFGYALWRLDDRLENPEKIASGLRGCCGQMDARVFGDRLAIAVNTKHCVELRDFAGESVGTVGHRVGAGDDPAGFGGCCNPMNTCATPDGDLLTSESNGVVKRFAADGTFLEIVAKVQVKPGCKNSTIAIEPDGSRLYFLDAEHGNVFVLTPAEARAPDSTGQES